MYQFPINSNIATTGHKLQGMSKDLMVVTEWGSFPNWVYVVLSPVRTNLGLFIVIGGSIPKFLRTLPRSGRQPSFSTDTLGIFYERRFNAEAPSIQLKSVGVEIALVAVITHAKGGLQTKPLKLRIDLINTCAQFQWLGLSPVLSRDVSATRAKLCPNRLSPPSMDGSASLPWP